MSLSEALQKALAGLPTTARVTDFNDETIKSSNVEGYKAKEGTTDRIAVINPSLVVVGRAHYGGDGVGYVLCKSEYSIEGGAEVLVRKGLCCNHMPEAKVRIAVPIIKYATKPNGELIKPLQMEYLIWRINDEKFTQLRTVHKEWGLDKHDIIISCTDEQYQKLSMTVARERLISLPEVEKEFGAGLIAYVNAITPKLAKQVGNDLTDQQLLEKLGKTAAATVKVSDTPLGNIDDLLGPKK